MGRHLRLGHRIAIGGIGPPLGVRERSAKIDRFAGARESERDILALGSRNDTLDRFGPAMWREAKQCPVYREHGFAANQFV